jgi:hypothetical protein
MLLVLLLVGGRVPLVVHQAVDHGDCGLESVASHEHAHEQAPAPERPDPDHCPTCDMLVTTVAALTVAPLASTASTPVLIGPRVDATPMVAPVDRTAAPRAPPRIV